VEAERAAGYAVYATDEQPVQASKMVAASEQEKSEGGGTPRRKGARPIASSMRITPKSSDLPAIKSFKDMQRDENEETEKASTKSEGNGTPRRRSARPIASSARITPPKNSDFRSVDI